MKRNHRIVGIVFAIFLCGSLAPHIAADEPAKPLLLAHYMPWYSSPPFGDPWGWHWTMNRFRPDETDANGRRSIASHQYPLIEPYDSGDPAVLECQVLLMKYAGINGVIVDWYGAEDANDYAQLNRNTRLIIERIRRAGLRFAICYEDRSLRAMADARRFAESVATEHGKAALRYLRTEWFRDPLYLRQDGRPVLLIFGPDYLSNEQWNEVLSALPERPMVATLHERREFADGAFAWPPMWASENGVLTIERLNGYLDSFAEKSKMWRLAIAAAFPGFHDIYEQAGLHASFGYLDDRDGETFRETLNAARRSGFDLIQLVTWNDYGEGTVVEPTAEQGYRCLETTQEAQRSWNGGFPYVAEDLRLPVRLFRLRKQFAENVAAVASLDGVASALFDGNPTLARGRLARFAERYPSE